MPAGRSNAITVSFAKKNKDVLELLEAYKKDSSFVQNDYICEAVRFYEKNKDREFNTINKDEIRKLVDERFQELKNELLNDKESLVSLDDEKEQFNDAVLEENIQNINPAFFDKD